MEFANAHPRKRFFLQMFTRDIALEDTVLDLIDNSIDGLTRSRALDISPALLTQPLPRSFKGKGLPSVRCQYSADEFVLTDTCGGIPRDLALKELFTFGHSEDYKESQLGVYGIGLKRALFKIGQRFEIQSRTIKEGFKTRVDLVEWAKKDEAPEDWRIPLTFIDGAESAESAGTSIKISHLTPEVRTRLKDPAFTADLRSAISKTYLLFLDRYAAVSVERSKVDPWVVPLGRSKDVTPAHKDFTLRLEGGTVRVKLIASLAERGERNEWAYERAGWYVFCNNRAVLAADKSELTGWGAAGLPKYHSKYNGFIGLLFFESTNPLLLPWRTTKRGVNADSMAYQRIRPEMAAAARPIITFLNDMYPSEIPEQLPERAVAEGVKGVDLRSFAGRGAAEFAISRPRTRTPSRETVSIQFNASKRDVDRIKKATRQMRLSASKIGEFTFKHFVEHELAE
jgi:Histidine kinase-, DNA gyrase B-, and HSP90-like ATPase